MSQSHLFSKPSKTHGRQSGHVRLWKRQQAITIKELWNAGVPMKEICAQLSVSEVRVDHVIRGNVCRDAGPPVTPRRAYGRYQKKQLRDLTEVPG